MNIVGRPEGVETELILQTSDQDGEAQRIEAGVQQDEIIGKLCERTVLLLRNFLDI